VTRLHHKKPNQLSYALTLGGECPRHENVARLLTLLALHIVKKNKVTDIAVDDRTKHALNSAVSDGPAATVIL
jgi:phosphatidate phosphatase PAH1